MSFTDLEHALEDAVILSTNTVFGTCHVPNSVTCGDVEIVGIKS